MVSVPVAAQLMKKVQTKMDWKNSGNVPGFVPSAAAGLRQAPWGWGWLRFERSSWYVEDYRNCGDSRGAQAGGKSRSGVERHDQGQGKEAPVAYPNTALLPADHAPVPGAEVTKLGDLEASLQEARKLLGASRLASCGCLPQGIGEPRTFRLGGDRLDFAPGRRIGRDLVACKS